MVGIAVIYRSQKSHQSKEIYNRPKDRRRRAIEPFDNPTMATELSSDQGGLKGSEEVKASVLHGVKELKVVSSNAVYLD